MSKCTEEARRLCDGKRYRIEFNLEDASDDQKVVLRRADLARIEKIAGLVPGLSNEAGAWQQIAIRERAKALVLREALEHGGREVDDGDLDEASEMFMGNAGEALCAEIGRVIVAEDGDAEILKALLKYLHQDLAKNKHFGDGVQKGTRMLRRWQKQLVGEDDGKN